MHQNEEKFTIKEMNEYDDVWWFIWDHSYTKIKNKDFLKISFDLINDIYLHLINHSAIF